jgi:hypothetical protein
MKTVATIGIYRGMESEVDFPQGLTVREVKHIHGVYRSSEYQEDNTEGLKRSNRRNHRRNRKSNKEGELSLPPKF